MSFSMMNSIEEQGLVFATPNLNRAKKINSPDLIKSSFILYLKDGFPLHYAWEHPTTKEIYEYRYIREKLNVYKKLAPDYYRALWCLIISRGKREAIARDFGYSSSTLKRIWDRAVTTMMFLMLYPELEESYVKVLFPTS